MSSLSKSGEQAKQLIGQLLPDTSIDWWRGSISGLNRLSMLLSKMYAIWVGWVWILAYFPFKKPAAPHQGY